MANFKIRGVVSNLTTQEGTSKKGVQYRIAEFTVTEQGEKYPNAVRLKYYGQADKQKFVDSFVKNVSNGSVINVEFTTAVREFNGKGYGENNVWSVQYTEKNQQQVADAVENLPF